MRPHYSLNYDTKSDIYVFDKCSYSIIGRIETKDQLISIFGDKMVVLSGFYIYKIQKISFLKSNSFDSFAHCNMHDQLKGPHSLPCGCYSCLDCIFHHYNLFKRTFKCKRCNQEYQLPEKISKSITNDSLNQNFIEAMVYQRIKLISEIGISFVLINFKFIFFIFIF